MLIAIFGDIHGNIEALKAAYHEARIIKADNIYHLGDVGGYAPFVNEVVDFLVEHNIDGVQGNYDEAVANDREHCGCKYEDPLQAEIAQMSFEWTKKHAAHTSKEYMRKLPNELSLMSNGKRVKLFRATPRKNNLYWYEDRPGKFFLEMAELADADILVYGHTHKPYTKSTSGKTFINAGSVGKPKDNDPRACIAVIEITSSIVATAGIRVSDRHRVLFLCSGFMI
jgi:putative phosphoesterase